MAKSFKSLRIIFLNYTYVFMRFLICCIKTTYEEPFIESLAIKIKFYTFLTKK